MINYIVEYKQDHDYTNTKYYKILTFDEVKTWRELQKAFDPKYRYNSLKFFYLGLEIPFTS